MKQTIIGIDTSCYTTSIALVDENGDLVDEKRQLLAVSEGCRGLSQSTALFVHIRDGCQMIGDFLAQYQTTPLVGVAVSAAPRPQADSYMPVFLAGVSYATTLAAARGVPLYKTSHQEGHLAAAASGLPTPLPEQFLAVHLSGGTTEILQVERQTAGFKIELLGGSSDLQAGQFVDRVGVAMGLSFPAGAALDKLACSAADSDLRLPVQARQGSFSLSGAETAAQRLLAQGAEQVAVAQAVLLGIGSGLEKTLLYWSRQTGLTDVLLAGGVAGSLYLRQRLTARLERKLNLHFAPARLCSDNAIGIALLGRQALL